MRALAIDLEEPTRPALWWRTGRSSLRKVVTTDGTKGLKPSLPELAATLLALAKTSGVQVETCAGLAFSFCAMVDSRSTRILSTNQKYDDARDLDLQDWTKRSLVCPCARE